MKLPNIYLPDDRDMKKDFKEFVRDAAEAAINDSLYTEKVSTGERLFKVKIHVEVTQK